MDTSTPAHRGIEHDDAHVDERTDGRPASEWWCSWSTGPDAGVGRRLGPGRHLVGRAHGAALRCDDPGLEPHHALLEVRADGTIELTQLTGRVPLLIARPGGNHAIDGPTVIRADGPGADRGRGLTVTIEIGGSTLELRRRGGPAAAGDRPRATAAHIRQGALVRAPRAVPEWQPTALVAPAPAPARAETTGGLLPALLGLAGAGAIALVLQQPMFLLFGALGGLVAIASWGAQRWSAVRRHRQATAAAAVEQRAHLDAVARERAAFRAMHTAAVPTPATARDTIIERSAALWSRRAAHPDAYLAAVGIGDVTMPSASGGAHPTVGWMRSDLDLAGLPAVDTPSLHHDLPVAASLGPGSRLAVHGPRANAVIRSLVVQLAASCGPADMRIVIVTDRPDRWDCLRGLPHLALPDGSVAVVDEAGLPAVLAEVGGHAAHLLLATDQPGQLATRTSPLRRVLADEGVHALLVAVPADDGVPHLCTSVLTLSHGPTGRWVADTTATLLPTIVKVCGIGERAAFACTAALRGLVDPEDPLSVASGVPREVSLMALLAAGATTPAGVLAAWHAAGPNPSPRTPIGVAADGTVDIDLVRDGPHGLIAGTTGAGKSELLRSLVVGMAAHAGPTHLNFVLVDYKGGATFDACEALPHVVGVITDLDDALADRALRSLHAELRRREAILREHSVADLPALRTVAPDVVMPRLVVVIDEFAALVAEQPAFLHALVGVAQRGRSLGVHLLLATQRPNGVISDDIRANTNLRLALRLQDTADAIDVVGIAAPALLPRSLPGRAVLRLGADDHLTFQTARCTGPVNGSSSAAANVNLNVNVSSEDCGTELEVTVRAILAAAQLAGITAPAAPWLPPLPTTIERHQVATGALGLVDDPDRQRIVPLHWTPADGHLLIAGSPGSGATSALCTLAGATLATREPGGAPAWVYVLDGRGDERLAALAHHPRCGAVVGVHERERVMRMLLQLQQQARTRGAGTPEVLFMVDGLDAIRRTLDDVETAAEFEALEEVLADGEHAGITVVATVEQAAAVPAAFLARCPRRWVLHLRDAYDATLLGVATAAVPGTIPGRLVDTGGGLTAQLVVPGPPTLVDVATCVHPAPRIEVVPMVVQPGGLPAAAWRDGTTWMPWGVSLHTGSGHVGAVIDGEHLLVVGGPRTGRTTTLVHLAHSWRTAHPHGWVGVIAPRRGHAHAWGADAVGSDATIAELLPATGPALLLIDDAELVDDSTGRLAALAAGGRADTLLVAAGRPDALRAHYGHWTAVVRRSRAGIVLTGGSDLDGDLLGVVLPRRTPVTPRPGLAWVIDGGRTALVQLATSPPAQPVPAATASAHAASAFATSSAIAASSRSW